MRIALVAGEASGDTLGAGLIHALRERIPDAEFAGIGGPRMADAGQLLWAEAEELAVMGLAEVLAHLPRLLRLRKRLHAELAAWRPDVYIGIDAPDFNLGIERVLKARGVPTVHYVSPSIWAWRQSRAAKIGQSADLVLCLFPFEPALYEVHGVEAVFVGHPLAEQLPMEPAVYASRALLRLPIEGRVLALLPGSRAGEISRLGPVFLEVARQLKQRLPKLTVVAPMASPRCLEQFRALIRPEHGVVLIEGQAQSVLQAADAVLIASGTATLEAALAKKPMLVAYKLHPLTYWLATRFNLLKTRWFSLPNQLAGDFLVPERAQAQVTVETLLPMVEAMLTRPPDPELIAEYRAMHVSLKQDADARAADAVTALLAARRTPA